MNKILIVDDDEGIRENLELRLRSKGYDVTAAKDGKEALEIFKSADYDLVLLDVMMPRMDGYEACKQIKKVPGKSFVPVLMLTALNQVDEKVKGLDAGADDFISKPFNDNELTARIKAFLRIKSLHDELRENYEKLQKLEQARDSLTSLIVHDLKSPISSISAAVSLYRLKHKENIPPDTEDLFQKIKRYSDAQIDMISDILEISKMEDEKLALGKQEFDAGRLVEDCLAQVESFAQIKSITLEKNIESALPGIFADKNIIQRILMNLISNSLKYTSEGDYINVTLNHIKDKGVFVFTVSDSGTGIPENDLEKIFERFFQGDESSGRARKGVGLGLYFCKMAVESHGGNIRALSNDLKGSSFIFEIPSINNN